jgi:flagellin
MSISIQGSSNPALVQTFEQLSTGNRINKAADDPAGLAVAAALDSAVASEGQALRNINDGFSVAQVADGALESTADILMRMRELAVQASSETLAANGRDAIQTEYEQLAAQVDQVAESTEFSGVALTDGSRAELALQVGPDAGDSVSLTLPDLQAATLGVDTASLDLSTASGAQSAIDAIDGALDQVGSARSELGASQNRLSSSLDTMIADTESLSAASSRIQDTDYGEAITEQAQQLIMQDVNIAVQAQANLSRASMMSLLF